MDKKKQLGKGVSIWEIGLKISFCGVAAASAESKSGDEI